MPTISDLKWSVHPDGILVLYKTSKRSVLKYESREFELISGYAVFYCDPIG